MSAFSNNRTINKMTFILAVISIVILGAIADIVIAAKHYTRSWFEISVILPNNPDIAGAYLLYRPVDDDDWTVAGEVAGQAGEMVNIRVVDLPDGAYMVPDRNDVNGDGKVDAADIQAVVNRVLGMGE